MTRLYTKMSCTALVNAYGISGCSGYTCHFPFYIYVTKQVHRTYHKFEYLHFTQYLVTINLLYVTSLYISLDTSYMSTGFQQKGLFSNHGQLKH